MLLMTNAVNLGGDCMILNFQFKYQVRFTSVSNGEDFAAEHKAYIEWINSIDEFNRAFIFSKHNLFTALTSDERVVQFNHFR